MLFDSVPVSLDSEASPRGRKRTRDSNGHGDEQLTEGEEEEVPAQRRGELDEELFREPGDDEDDGEGQANRRRLRTC